MKTNFITIIALASILITISSCSKKKPSIVYFPDMYYAVAYDPLQAATLPYQKSSYENSVPLFQEHNGRTALDVVPQTVYRNKSGVVPTDWERGVTKDNYNAKYDLALAVTKSPLDSINKEVDLKRGKFLYEKTCVVCHGDLGDGKGPIVESGAFTGVPNYKDRAITVGSVYFVINHGRNLMGSYAGQLEIDDRWRVAQYVMNEFKK